jgi:hypothetical protein
VDKEYFNIDITSYHIFEKNIERTDKYLEAFKDRFCRERKKKSFTNGDFYRENAFNNTSI